MNSAPVVRGYLRAVSVGRPKTITWRGREVSSAIWKTPVSGRRWVGRLNVKGDDQADRVGHGGEHRALFVYQRESYAYWERKLKRVLEGDGTFGENLTVEGPGLADEEVRIGDRFAIGDLLVEVTQPRVTCYKVGIRLGEPRMPALLTGHGRPGFYLRVLREGEIGAGDPVTEVARGPEAMTVRAVSDLLYRPGHDPAELAAALRLEALPEGWKASFAAMLEAARTGVGGNPGLKAAPRPVAWSGFKSFAVAAVADESAHVRSLELVPADGSRLGPYAPGQFVTLRIDSPRGPLVRSYSLSREPDERALRISVKREGVASARLHALAPGDLVELGAPRGDFTLPKDLAPGTRIAFVSAGIGVTPLRAMLGALVAAGAENPVVWVQVVRGPDERPLAAEVDALLARLPAAVRHLRYTRAGTSTAGADAVGRLDAAALVALGLGQATRVFVCGPSAFMTDVTVWLQDAGLPAEAIHAEAFGSAASSSDGAPPAAPEDAPAEGPLVTFARSGVSVHVDGRWSSLLEVAEACRIPAQWSCRTGVCHRCETGLVAGSLSYAPEPLDPPAIGAALICCSWPAGDVILDL